MLVLFLLASGSFLCSTLSPFIAFSNPTKRCCLRVFLVLRLPFDPVCAFPRLLLSSSPMAFRSGCPLSVPHLIHFLAGGRSSVTDYMLLLLVISPFGCFPRHFHRTLSIGGTTGNCRARPVNALFLNAVHTDRFLYESRRANLAALCSLYGMSCGVERQRRRAGILSFFHIDVCSRWYLVSSPFQNLLFISVGYCALSHFLTSSLSSARAPLSLYSGASCSYLFSDAFPLLHTLGNSTLFFFAAATMPSRILSFAV